MRRPNRLLLFAAALVSVITAAAPQVHLHAAPNPPRPPRLAPPPPAPPAAAPATLTARSSTGRVHLEWTAVPGAVGYYIYRGNSAGTWDAAPIASVRHLRFTNWGLPNGTAYAYKVAAYNKGGPGPMSNTASATPLAPPTNLQTISGNQQVALMWQASAGATGYQVLRRAASGPGSHDFTQVAAVAVPSFIDMGLANGTKYVYRVRAVAAGGNSSLSWPAWGKPTAPPPPAPASLSATPGNGSVTLEWPAVAGATSYRIFRSTNGTFDGPPAGSTSKTTYKITGLVNGTAYSFRVSARGASGDGPMSPIATATPAAPTAPPTGVAATAGNTTISVSWSAVAGATGYNVYRGTSANGQSATPVALNVSAPPFVNTGLTNGITYFYKVTAISAAGESVRSSEANATPEAPPAPPNPDALSAFRLLKQATWGPRPGDIDHVMNVGVGGFLTEQFGAAPSLFPAAAFSESVEAAQERWMQMALTGPDQLRQRVAWALHKIWVVSAVEVPETEAMLVYYGEFQNRAFGNYRDLMRAITLNPAMGRYLNMVNNRSRAASGVAPNENYPRELMQLFTLGLSRLNPDGTPVMTGGAPVPTYTEEDVKELARILTGWTYGDGNPTPPTSLRPRTHRFPMEAVAAFHDNGAKRFLGVDFPAGQTAVQDLDQALDVLFDHQNIAPFVSRQLIQQLVTSNPSPAYVGSIASTFRSSNGNIGSVVSAILTHPEANLSTPTSGKLSEPVLFTLSFLRALGAGVTDHPFLSDRTAAMGQRVFYPPSVFSYFSPGYRVAGTGTPPLGGPEFQILTSVTALERTNFAAALLGNHFGGDVAVDYTPFATRASDANALVDFCNLLFMGGRMSAEERAEIAAAVRVTPTSNALERARTAIYLTVVAAQAQVDR